MRVILLHFILLNFIVFGQNHRILSRHRRDASGALDIITNHAQPIHADVKHDNSGLSERPCSKTYVINLPPDIESGIVFQVTPPRDTIYNVKSLRKSLPLTTKLDLVRAVSRVVTLVTLLFSAIVEFYPLVQHMYNLVYEFMYYNTY